MSVTFRQLTRRVLQRIPAFRYTVTLATGAAIIVLLYAIRGEAGFKGRSLWDWMDLLIIPAILVGGILWLTQRKVKLEQGIARENRHEDILQHYVDRMTALMADENWLSKTMTDSAGEENRDDHTLSPEAARLFDIARLRTVAVLHRLEADSQRQASVLLFIKAAYLFKSEIAPALLAGAMMSGLNLDRLNLSFINLQGADLRRTSFEGADLRWAKLQSTYSTATIFRRADLRHANLWGANLEAANLQGADLRSANLQKTHLWKADLQSTVLENANLQGAILDMANLKGALLLGANLYHARLWATEFDRKTVLPDGTKWTPETDVDRFTEPKHSNFWQPKWVKDLHAQQADQAEHSPSSPPDA